MKFVKGLGITVLVLIVIYFLGPRPATPASNELPAVPAALPELEKYIREQESAHNIKPDNEARIIWHNDTLKQKTLYSLVYLHGFSASQEEGDPVHTRLAQQFGCNLYLARLAEHGLETTEPMVDLTADKLWNSAKEAFAIGKQIGNKVILIGTSTGGTLALKLAAEYPEIAGLILLSPNIAINDPNAWILNNHWGLQIARLVKGKYNTSSDTTEIYKKYWYHRYRMESTVELEELLETSMKASVFEKIKQPTLLLYYYKDEDHQDKVVKVSAMARMFRQLGTPDSLKRERPVPGAGDHVIGSHIKSKDVGSVLDEAGKFMEGVMHIPVID
ncbi:MAG TPA: alpha/beta hydrolase [Chitinophagaceae bacterium]|nr:alpha/beta hydrolase [Chitinophagaceae bacterium]